MIFDFEYTSREPQYRYLSLSTMLRRPPTNITLTQEDIAAYEDARAREAAEAARARGEEPVKTSATARNGPVDPNDELRPLPGEKARIVRTREERIGITGRN